MKLGTKIILGFIATCAIFVAISVYIIFALNVVEGEAVMMEKSVMPTFSSAAEAQYVVAIEALYVLDYDHSANSASWDKSLNYRRQVQDEIRKLREHANDPAIRQNPEALRLFQELESNYKKFTDINDRLPDINKSLGDSAKTVTEAYNDFIAGTEAFRKSQNDSFLNELRAADTSNEALKSRVDRLNMTADLETHAGQYLINTLSGLANRDVSFFDKTLSEVNECRTLVGKLLEGSKNKTDIDNLNNLKTLADDCERAIKTLIEVGNTNVSTTAERAGLRDATLANAGALADAMNKMTMELTTDISQATNTVLTTLIVGVLVALIISIVLGLVITRGITGPVNRLIEMLSEGANEVDSASNQLTSASNTLAEGATENAASLEETSAALEELSSMTKRNADNAMEANALMAQAQSAVEKADSSMGSVIRAMEEISVSGNEIGKIIKTIDEIAFQTNLLALNAAVEAARAGEAGAGFAVVADEVRNLAIRSADAAKNTADLIASTISNISSGSEMVNATAENFKTVESHSSKVAELLAEVSEASKEQSQGIGQITTAMTEMDKVTQSNAASAEESASAAGQLSLQASNLLEAVDNLDSLVHGASRGTISRRPAPKPTLGYQSVGRPASSARPAKALPQKKDEFDMDDGFDF